MISVETRRVKDAADKRRLRAERKHAAFTLTGTTCACGEKATCLAIRSEFLPGKWNSLSHHGWTISSQRVRAELTTREPTCRPCASKTPATEDSRHNPGDSRRLVRPQLNAVTLAACFQRW